MPRCPASRRASRLSWRMTVSRSMPGRGRAARRRASGSSGPSAINPALGWSCRLRRRGFDLYCLVHPENCKTRVSNTIVDPCWHRIPVTSAISHRALFQRFWCNALAGADGSLRLAQICGSGIHLKPSLNRHGSTWALLGPRELDGPLMSKLLSPGQCRFAIQFCAATAVAALLSGCSARFQPVQRCFRQSVRDGLDREAAQGLDAEPPGRHRTHAPGRGHGTAAARSVDRECRACIGPPSWCRAKPRGRSARRIPCPTPRSAVGQGRAEPRSRSRKATPPRCCRSAMVCRRTSFSR